MSKIAYFDCPTGIAGDMCLGALVDAGVPVDYLTEHLNRLGVGEDYSLRVERVRRNGISAMKAYVDLRDMTEEPPTFDAEKHHHHHHSEGNRYLPEIEEMLQSADIPDRARKWSLAVFRRLAAAEGAVHGVSLDRVHFHEVGATDAIVDIVGTCLGLDWLEIDRLYCSPLPTGGGTVKAAHGRIPVPAPAVLKLWEMRQVPVYGNGIDRELVTPTGAALTVTLVESFGVPPAMTLQQTGLGAGSREFPIPNVLRLWIGEDTQPSASDRVCVLETQLDDISPQAIGYVFDKLFDIGALDVFTQPVGMKKNRPGVLLTVICSPDKQTDCEAVLFRETTTLGIRHSFQERSILSREFRSITLFDSEVRVKIARDAKGNVINVQPEYEDVAKVARKQKLSWQEVHRLALQQWQQEKAV
ncbi:nickel pincer cofactor biosynthesis protein LarC [Baaleninema simplex]|uniref:nickel pincer cofactor biosynthesis protein LarC n=1 Tax=Baaleninema simplex TaxID=2862350 RepID=UPI0004782D88|nr:nickel pincer cofactor biosynthesis protein LarC [Baaleninema simplex]